MYIFVVFLKDGRKSIMEGFLLSVCSASLIDVLQKFVEFHCASDDIVQNHESFFGLHLLLVVEVKIFFAVAFLDFVDFIASVSFPAPEGSYCDVEEGVGLRVEFVKGLGLGHLSSFEIKFITYSSCYLR